nr:flagellar hook-length control protein FliK [uncultured Cohaesibacter sp.]
MISNSAIAGSVRPHVTNKLAIHGDSQNQNRNGGRDDDAYSEADASSCDQLDAEDAQKSSSRAKHKGDQSSVSFEHLLELVNSKLESKDGSDLASDASAIASDRGSQSTAASQPSVETVEQLLAQAGFGKAVEAQTTTAGGSQLLDGTPLAASAQQQGQEPKTSAIATFLSAVTGDDAAGAENTAGLEEKIANGTNNQDGGAKGNLFGQSLDEQEKLSLGTLDQLTKAAKASSEQTIDPSTLKTQSLEMRANSAFDQVMPLVKDAVLSPLQRSQEDGFTLLRQETHFAPINALEEAGIEPTKAMQPNAGAVLSQIADAIKNNPLADSTSTSDTSMRSWGDDTQWQGSLRLQRSGDALRVLDIQLHPADLGKVRLSVRLNENNVEVRIEATKAETAKLLESNQTELNKILQKAGYHADRISVIAVDEKGASHILPPSHNDSLNQQSDQGRSAFAGFGNGSNEGSDAQQHAPAKDENAPTPFERSDGQDDGTDHASMSDNPLHRRLTL